MSGRRLIWRVTPGYVLAIVLCTSAAAWFAGESVREFYLAQTARELENKANIFVPMVRRAIDGTGSERLQDLCVTWGEAAGARLTVVDRDGLVLGDSDQDPATMVSHADRPEIRTAYEGRVGRSTRYSSTLETHMMYVALPVSEGGEVTTVVRTAIALSDVRNALRSVYTRIALGGFVTAVLAVLLTLLVFHRHIHQPLRQLQEGAQHFADGRFHLCIPDVGSKEIGSLAAALNNMAGQLDEKIRTITTQSREQQAILSSMTEGVLAVDSDSRVITLNQAAGLLLGVDPAMACGRVIHELVRNTDIHDFVGRALVADDAIDGEITLPTAHQVHDPAAGQERYLDAYGAALLNHQGDRAGAVVVLHDRTRMRQLETIRQQFVANVSHELKTPVTAIKAAAETMLDALDARNEQEARFLGMIARQADRLGAIIDDLLSLARIEQQNEQGQLSLRACDLLPILKTAEEACRANAQSNKAHVSIACDPTLQAEANEPLLIQAVTNLLDNAIKYGLPGVQVSISARADGEQTVIEVTDNGPGIEPSHLPRIFERFYRTDKARSRDLGGTGLGLAIVKHIAAALGGQVKVESVYGQDQSGHGSTFRLYLRPTTGRK